MIPRKHTIDDPTGREDNHHLQHSMDVFSAGCLIAELFRDSHSPLFTLATLQDYASGKFDLKGVLEKIFDAESFPYENMKDMVTHMLSLDASSRHDAGTYSKRSDVFPACYKYMYILFEKIFKVSPERRVYTLCCEYVDVGEHLSFSLTDTYIHTHTHKRYGTLREQLGMNKDEEGERYFMFCATEIAHSLGIITATTTTTATNQNITSSEKNRNKFSPNVILPILSLLTSTLRNLRLPNSRVACLDMIASLGEHVKDEIVLQRLVPFAVSMFSDTNSRVRATSLRVLTRLLSGVTKLPRGELAIFQEFLLPALNAMFTQSQDRNVLVCMAECLPKLAQVARFFLELSHAERVLLVQRKETVESPGYVGVMLECENVSLSLYLSLSLSPTHTHTHTHTRSSRVTRLTHTTKTTATTSQHSIFHLNDYMTTSRIYSRH